MKTFSIFLSLIFMLTLLPLQQVSASNCAHYSDVDSGIWYCQYLPFLLEQKILDKYQKQFHPSNNLNRAEALKILYSAAGERTEKSTASFFDIAAGTWFFEYFYSAYATHYIQPENQLFSPSATISKAEFVILFMKIFEVEPGNGNCDLRDKNAQGEYIPTNPKVGSWILIDSSEKNKYLCEAKDSDISSKVGEQTLDRATAMAVLAKALRDGWK